MAPCLVQRDSVNEERLEGDLISRSVVHLGGQYTVQGLTDEAVDDTGLIGPYLIAVVEGAVPHVHHDTGRDWVKAKQVQPRVDAKGSLDPIYVTCNGLRADALSSSEGRGEPRED